MARRAPKPRALTLLAVAVGGGFGALARVYLPWPTLFAAPMHAFDPLPLAIINFFGAALLGFVTGIATTRQWPEPLAKGISTGFFGSFTSMSALAVVVSALSFGQAIFTDAPSVPNILASFGVVLGIVVFLWLTTWITIGTIKLGTRVGRGD